MCRLKCAQRWDSVSSDLKDKVKPCGSKGTKFEKQNNLLWKHYSESVEGTLLVRAHTENG